MFSKNYSVFTLDENVFTHNAENWKLFTHKSELIISIFNESDYLIKL